MRGPAVCSLVHKPWCMQCAVLVRARFQLVVSAVTKCGQKLPVSTRKDNEPTLILYFRESSDFHFEISLNGFV